MTMKTAILQVSDTGPLESLVVMLQAAGYSCYIPCDGLKRNLRSIGCDTVLDIEGLVKGWGYENPISLTEASIRMMEHTNLYVDIKAHRNGPIVWERWPNLRKKTLWYRINGGEPEHVIKGNVDYGDEVHPPCPVLTPNRWYAEKGAWSDKSYSCWPPFLRFGDYLSRHGRRQTDKPICLIHNIAGWGYGLLINALRDTDLGIRFYGAGSPDGLVGHAKIPKMLSSAIATVHLKSSDAPGYALYESLAAGCPCVVPRRLIWRSRMQELFIPGVTCFVFDRETHAGLSADDVKFCTDEISAALDVLSNPSENLRIGNAGRARLAEIMWRENRDGASFVKFMERHFS